MPFKRLGVASRFTPELSKVMAQSRLFAAMEASTSLSVAGDGDDFFGQTLDANLWLAANGGGASAASPVITGGALNGIVDFVTGTANGSTASSELSMGLSFRGDHGAVVLACLAVSDISNVKIEMGFTDVATDPGAVNVKATPSFNATDCALWVLDTSDNAFWEGLGANNQDTAVMPTVEAAISPVNDTFEWLMLELMESDADNNECAVEFSRFTQDGSLTFREIGGGIGGNQGPNSNVLLTPWLYVEARNATSKTLSVDFFGAYQFRAPVR